VKRDRAPSAKPATQETDKTEVAALEYSYLLLSATVAAVGFAGSLAVPRYRWFLVTSGLLATPAGLADWIFVPEYWKPDHLIGPWFSVEGMLFSFGNGCLIMLPVVLRWPDMIPPRRVGLFAPLARLTAAMSLGMGTFLITWQNGFGSLMIMHATYFGLAAIAIFLFLNRRFSLEIALFSGLGFSLLYAGETMVWHWIDPQFRGFWSAEGAYFFSLPFPPGLPIEEYIWAFAYAAVWANLMLHGFNVQWQAEWRLHGAKRGVGRNA
jgi:hypothetical protein